MKRRKLRQECFIMINEFKQLLDGALEANIEIEKEHINYGKAGGSEALRIILGMHNRNPVIDSIQYMDSGDIDSIWIMKTSNQDQFPAIKLKYPLRLSGNKPYQEFKRLSLGDKKRELCDFLIKYAFDENELSSYQSFPDAKKYRNSIIDRKDNLLLYIEENPVDELVHVANIYEYFCQFENNGLDLLKKIDAKLEEYLKKNEEMDEKFISLCLNALYGSKLTNAKNELSDRVTLIFDYQPNPDVDIFATNDSSYKRVINEYLINSDKPKIDVCSLTGAETSVIEKCPEINLGKGLPISKIQCYSKKIDGKPYAKRYNRGGSEGYVFSRDIAYQFSILLRFITQREFKNKLWCGIPRDVEVKRIKSDLLIAFCRSNLEVPFVNLLVGDIEDAEDYVSTASDIMTLLEGKKINPSTLIDFILVRKIDDGNQKIIYSGRYSLPALKDAATRWSEAGKNIPDFELFINKKLQRVKPWGIAPAQLINLSKYTYEMDGTPSKGSIPAISFAQSMRLFMEEGSQFSTLAQQLLNKITQQSQWLFNLCAVHQATHAHEKLKTTVGVKESKNALMYATLLGILLVTTQYPKIHQVACH